MTRNQRHKVGPGPWCGTAGGYSNHLCRCDACTEAWRTARLDYMNRNPEQRERHRARDRDRANQPQEATA